MWDSPRMELVAPVRLGPLNVRRVAKDPGKASETSLTVVLMHGFGAPGDDLVAMAGSLVAPPGTTFLFPEAPLSLGDLMPVPIMGDARAWWPIDIGRFERAMRSGALDRIVDEIPEGLAKARADLVAMLDEVKSDRIVLGGFSQGSMLATDVVLRSERTFAGLAILSGTYLASSEWTPRMATKKGLKVFQSHGRGDELLPYSIAEKLKGAMVDAGMNVSFTPFEGGHGIPPSVMRDLGTWLSKV